MLPRLKWYITITIQRRLCKRSKTNSKTSIKTIGANFRLAGRVTLVAAALIVRLSSLWIQHSSVLQYRGAGIAQWLEHRTRDWKVGGSNPCWNGGRIFFSRVDFLCWLLFRYPFHPRVTTVARKKSRSFCQSAGGRLQLNTHTPYVCGFYWTVLRHWSQLVPNMSNDIWGH